MPSFNKLLPGFRAGTLGFKTSRTGIKTTMQGIYKGMLPMKKLSMFDKADLTGIGVVLLP